MGIKDRFCEGVRERLMIIINRCMSSEQNALVIEEFNEVMKVKDKEEVISNNFEIIKEKLKECEAFKCTLREILELRKDNNLEELDKKLLRLIELTDI